MTIQFFQFFSNQYIYNLLHTQMRFWTFGISSLGSVSLNEQD